jgi:Tol biopolymer transport system component
VAFFSPSRGMATNIPTFSVGEVYLRDLVAGTTLWVSSNTNAPTLAGNPNLSNYHPKISDDGRFVAFKLSAYDGGRAALIFQYDAASNSLLLVASNTVPQLFNDDVYGPEMTPDGRFIAYVIGGPTNQPLRANVYLADTQAGTNVLVSVCQDGTTSTNSDSDTPMLSPDGRYVAFVSNATNLVANAISDGSHIYLRDMVAGTTTLVDAGTNGVAVSDQYGNAPSMRPDGKWVAFASPDGNLVSHPQNQSMDVFARDMTAGTNELISPRDATVVPASSSGVHYSAQTSITPNGRWVVFSSSADDLVTNDFNGNQDIFVSDLALGSITLASVGVDGNAAAGFSANPVISSNGQFVVFFSEATNLMANSTNIWGGIFLRDLVARTNTLVSVSIDGAPANGISIWPAMSQDGRYIAFLSTATNLVAPPTTANRTNVFWRDMVTGTTVVAATNASTTFPTSISADGRYVAYPAPGNTAAVWDSQTLTNIYSAPGVNASAVVSPTGAALLSQGSSAVKVYSMALQSNVFSMTGTAGVRSPAQWSADGRFVTFVARSNVASGPFTNNQIFLGDMVAGTIALISSTPDHSTGGNGASDSPTLSGNGRVIVYRSDATDIVTGRLSASNLIVFDRATGSNTLINIGTAGSDWTGRVARPLLDAAAQTVTFQSLQSGLVPGDLNRAPDVFAGQPAILVDTDGDGIPDWWMLKYFGHATGSPGDHSLAQDDADGDGFSNLQEFLGGTDPTDGQSFLKVQISAPDAVSNTATLNWPTVAGKSYQVQYKTNLDDPMWSNFGAPIVATSSINISVPLTSSSGFYRVIAVN